MMWDYNILNPGLVALLGVSSATAIGSAVVDKNKAAQRRSDAMEPAPPPQSTTPLSPGERGGKQEVERTEQLPSQEVARRRKSRGGGFSSFVQDILSDENADTGTVEFYRLQNALWTLFLGVTFVRAIWNTAALPELDANLVILMGVSSGTYVGLKASK
jgi:hypothetical protein